VGLGRVGVGGSEVGEGVGVRSPGWGAWTMTAGELVRVGATVVDEKREISEGVSAKDMAKLPHRIRIDTNAARNPEVSSCRLFMGNFHTFNQVHLRGECRLKGASVR
jgi:hypothetical protein